MTALEEIYTSERAYLAEVRERIFFNRYILNQAKSESLIAIFKLEHGLPVSKREISNLNNHLLFIGVKTI